MYPEILRIGDFVVSSFGLMMVLSFVASYFQISWGFSRLGIGDSEDASALVFAAGLGGILGAKIYYAALYGDWRLLFDRSGLVWYGGFLLAAVAVVWVIRRRRLPAWATLDVSTLALAVGYGIGRIGCFLVGDDYGRPTDLPWGVKFPQGLPETTAANMERYFGIEVPPGMPGDTVLAVHPTQLYETAIAWTIWGVGLWLFSRRPPAGTVALTMFALLALERFGVEFLRAKDDRFLGVFTLAQLISILVLVTVLIIAWRRRTAAARAAAVSTG